MAQLGGKAVRTIGLARATLQLNWKVAACNLRRLVYLKEARVADLHAWLLASQRSVAVGSGTAKAIEHALKRWPAMQRYASSGSLPIDNTPVENAIRPIAIGKKNWLFAGSERAGRRAAAILRLFATAKLNGLDPARWLADTLEKLPTCPNSKIDSLLSFAYSTQC
nr:transposase [Massilia atriviolacea]